MKQLTLQPKGWPCTLEECNPGHFLFASHDDAPGQRFYAVPPATGG